MTVLTTILLGAAMFFLPGYALLALVNPRLETDPVERFSLAVGLSLAVIPLSLYLSTLAGIRQGPTYLALFLGAAGLVTMWDFYRRWRTGGFEPLRRHWVTIVAFAIIALSALVARLLGVAGLEFPLWTDSYHHTLIAQIIADHGLVPSSYEPYAPIHEFSYHFGFHTLVAWFHWLTRTPIPRSVIVVGQVVNGLVVPTTYVLAKRLWKKPLIGLIAGGILGLFSHMPAFFVNWGRYTQLDGQILLPITIALFIYSLEKKRGTIRFAVLAAISLAGLFLTHNRITIFALVLSATIVLFHMLPWHGQQPNKRKIWISTSIFLILAALVDLSWIVNFIRVFGNHIAGMFQAGYSKADFGSYFEWSIGYFTEFGANLTLWMLAFAGAVWGLAKRERGVLWLLAGSGCIFVLALAYLIGLPGPYSVLIVVIWLNLPIALLAAFFMGQTVSWWTTAIPVKIHSTTAILVSKFALLILAAFIGWRSISNLTLPENGFVRDADLKAMTWINDHTHMDSVFYISTQFWTPHLAHGLDAGYWIPYFTGRLTTIPPQTYASDAKAEYMNDVNAKAFELMTTEDVTSLHDILLSYGVKYIYIGKRNAKLEPGSFQASPGLFDPVYEQEGIWIFRIIE